MWRILIPICRVAVPVFFIITGYFFGYEIDKDKKIKIRNKMVRIAKLSLFAFGLYLIFSFLTCILKPEKFIDYLEVTYWTEMIIFGNVPAVHLWYLIALLQSLGFIYICCNFKKTKWLYWLIPIGLLLNLLFGSYNFIIPDDIFSNNLLLSRNALTVGMPCILIGMLIRRVEPNLPSQRRIVVITITGLIGLYIETIILEKVFPPKMGDIILLTIPVATTVFIYFLRLDLSKSSSYRIASWGRAYSLDIYIWHVLIGAIVYFILKAIEPKFFNLVLLPVVIMSTLLFLKLLRHFNIQKLYS